jgi:hypothetical protein
MARVPTFRTFAPPLVALALALAGCSSGTGEVAEKEVEEQAATQLAAKVNQPKPNIDCPGGLKAEAGAKLDCVLTAEGDPARYPVAVTVTSVEDENVKFDIQVGDAPIP